MQRGLEVSVFAFLQHFPISRPLSWIFLLAVYISIATLADSMTSTMTTLSTTGAPRGHTSRPCASRSSGA